MKRTGVQSREHVVCSGVSLEDVLAHDCLPARGLDLALEEGQEVRVVLVSTEVLLGVIPVAELLGQSAVGPLGGALVRGVAVESLL